MLSIKLRSAVFVAVEHALLVLAVVLASLLRLGIPESAPQMVPLLWRASLIGVVLQVCMHFADLYDLPTISSRRRLLIGAVQSLGVAAVALAVLYYWLPTLVIGRGVLLIAAALMTIAVIGWRLAAAWISARVGPVDRLLIIGTGSAAVALAQEIYQRRQELGVELVGFIDIDPARVGDPIINPGVIGTLADVPRIVRERGADRVVVSLADGRGRLPMDELLSMKLNDGVTFYHLASVYERYTGKIAVENLRPSWLVFSEGFQRSRLYLATKRALDVLFSALGLILAAPTLLAVAIANRSTGPVLYHQRRVGKDGREFEIYKFRSMYVDAEAETGPAWASSDDPRVTPVGRFLRRTRLDELPQLWNILKGDMSFVGPRPERPEFVSELSAAIPFYGQRHVVRPGLTGWAQVRHDYGSSVEDALEKLQYELYYIKHMSLSFDLLIALETIKTVLVRPGS
jgi:sugar transferase (PEP-CTERM system associated)